MARIKLAYLVFSLEYASEYIADLRHLTAKMKLKNDLLKPNVI
jgi:hypothetical protein